MLDWIGWVDVNYWVEVLGGCLEVERGYGLMGVGIGIGENGAD